MLLVNVVKFWSYVFTSQKLAYDLRSKMEYISTLLKPQKFIYSFKEFGPLFHYLHFLAFFPFLAFFVGGQAK